MLEKPLGQTTQKIGAIGQGITGTGSRAEACRATDSRRIGCIRLGLDLGLSYVDTAELYGGGHSEEIVGKAITGRRESVFLATKFRPRNATPRRLRVALEASLRRLRTDYVDLYQMHWPSPGVSVIDTFGVLAELQAEGRVRYVGVSNFTAALLAKALRGSQINVVSNQVEYNLVDRSAEDQWIPFALTQKITTIAYSPFNAGRLHLGLRRQSRLQSIADGLGVTLHQLLLAWLIAQPNVIAVVRATREEHVHENAQARHVQLPEEQMKEIDLTTRREVVHVAADDVLVRDETKGYVSRSEAMFNGKDLDPSPESLAALIKQGFSKPIQLVARHERRGPRFELVGGNLLYWGYVISTGSKAEIPAYVVSGEDS